MAKLPTRKVIFDLVGEGHTNGDGSSRQQELLACEPGEPLALKVEFDNPHDPQAVSVFTQRGICIGYLAREDARTVRPALLEKRPHIAALHELRGGFGDYPSYGARASLTWDGKPSPAPVALDSTQLRARTGKAKIAGRERDAGGRLVATPSQGCLGAVMATVAFGAFVSLLFAGAV